jgi:hypothetical protein
MVCGVGCVPPPVLYVKLKIPTDSDCERLFLLNREDNYVKQDVFMFCRKVSYKINGYSDKYV